MTLILMLGAAPAGLPESRLDAERAALREHVPSTFQFEPVYAFRREQLGRELVEHRPELLHFSGHGAPDGELVVHGASHEAELLEVGALVELLRPHRDRLRCVFLNACYTAVQADELAEVIDVVIAAEGALPAETAVAFAVGFYGALARRKHVALAFDLGQAGVRGLSLGANPLRMFARSGIDPTTILFPSVTVEELIAALTELLLTRFAGPSLEAELLGLGLGADLNFNQTRRLIARYAADTMVKDSRISVAWFDGHIAKSRQGHHHARMRDFEKVRRLWLSLMI